MMKFIPLALIMFPCLINAQSISGRVLDESGTEMPYANVLLLNSVDSALVKGNASNGAGYYVIESIKPGNYIVAASMVGYKMIYTKIFSISSGQNVKIPELVLKGDVTQLGEVSVVATRPFIEQAIDRTVVNVSNSIISGGSTALEVLEKAPGISVDRQNDAIALQGKDGVIVMMDGKQTYLSMQDLVSMLRSMPSDNIDKIELITNPSSKYDAAGNSGIINIVLKKNSNFGTNGNVSLAVGTGEYGRQRGSIQINNRSKKFNIFGSYSATHGGDYWDFDLSRKQDDGEGGYNYVDQNSYIKFDNRGQNGKAGVDYAIGKNTNIGVVYSIFINSSGEASPAQTSIRSEENGSPHLLISTQKTLLNETSNQIGNINFQHTFGGKGGTISADFDLGHYQRDYSNELVTTTIYSEEPVDGLTGLYTVMPVTIDILTAKTDYSRTVLSDWKLDLGFKMSSVFSDNDMKLSSGPVEDMTIDQELSNHFQYTEEVHAMYASVVGKLGQVEVQAGLRAEHTHSKGESLSLNEVVERNYWNLFPTLFISRKLSTKQSLTFSYSHRIDRPGYQTLNPARSYLDPYSFSRGNPYLQPQYTHAIQLKHGWDSKIFTSVGADFVSDYIFYLIQPVDTESTERTPDNIGTSKSFNVNVSFPINFSKAWSFQGNMMALYTRLDYVYLGNELTVQQFTGRFNGTNSFNLGKFWTAELTGWLNTPQTNTIFVSPWRGQVDVGLQKVYKKNLKIKLSLQDVFKTYVWAGHGKTDGYEQDARITFDTRVLMLNVNYIFGNQQMKAVRQRNTASDDEVQRTN
jgi:hypothetical protein